MVEVGPGVDGIATGDEVFGDLFGHGFGAFAELVAAPASTLARKPADLTFEQVSTLPQAGALAWQGIHDGGPASPGDRVLVSGAGGGVGTFAIQLAKARGAEVTAVDRAAKRDLVLSLGASRFIDFETEDYTRSTERYDRIIDVQARMSVRAVRRVLGSNGRYAVVGGSLSRIIEAAVFGQLVSRLSDQWLGIVSWRSNDAAITEGLIESIRTGSVRSVIERAYPLADAAEAFRRLAAGDVHGKAVIVID